MSAETDIDALAEILRQGLEDFSCFDEYRSEILRCAENEFNAERKRKKVHEWLAAAAQGP
jgi:hypothetical protein